ncbi:sigma-70 family RNA polymerase sigma factor [Bacillus pseudomycoides]|uniref:sigma-70 family RNA polymerase sigma factor n=1 Tax=Bacillus pseudomycoides TaxID=64104 RepID=UPI000BEBB143|nr:sigma-70 family RNA polymerase sigma factor [Bacillus pseudomycoides]MED4651536.1 sigma-70 family RNA polymerase sigma factor [Bacillus pseudomycoides]PEB40944.1 RNA polymerase [Bacillus pseudomycoides]PEE03631.1 RNA polymerase [Bacillus pseudomycoides]PEF76243.1 RNA polymerase [Bacillus pseudomycoides]PEJ30419.1 RNA polymerase [Bacillus pseudomycoides]
MDEIKLVKKARKGDDAAFEQLISLYQDQLYRTAYLYVQNKEDALDIVQETVYKAYLSIEQLKKPNYFLTWLTRILIHNAYQLLSEKKKVKKIEDGREADTYGVMPNKLHQIEQNIDLQEAIQKLDENYQTVIILYYYHDLSINKIAWQMNIPEGTVKTYLHRARKALKNLLGGSEENWISSGLMTR